MSVFLRQIKRNNNDIALSIVEGKYDPKKRNTVQKVIRNLGLLEDLKKTYTDPIEHFTNEAKRIDEEYKEKYKVEKEEKIPKENQHKNIGYFPLKRLFDVFLLNEEFSLISRGKNLGYDLFQLFKFLTYSQVICPQSKQKEYLNKDIFIDKFKFSDDQMYRGISLFGEHRENILEVIQYFTKKNFSLDTSSTYFDGTNVYFEIDRETDMIKRGPEKNKRHDPIIGLGLLIDKHGIPISYTTFPGNQSEQPEMYKNVQSLKHKEGIVGKTIIVADKGLNSGDNMYQAVQNKDGYVIGQKVKNCDAETRTWILNDNDYTKTYTDEVLTYKVKSISDDFIVKITSSLNGAKVDVHLKQKRVVFWSKDYADKAKHERKKLIDKAKSIICNPSEYKKASVGSAANYIKEINYDKNGEIITKNLSIDLAKITEEEKLDGYYMIVTSEQNLEDQEIINIYRGLWEIEESFSIMKGVLNIRPVFAKTIEGIEAHFLISFISLLFLRIIQKFILKDELTDEQKAIIEKANKRKNKIRIEKVGETPIKQIVGFMREYNATYIGERYYFTKYNNLIPLFEEKYNLFLDRHVMDEKSIKKIFKS